MANDWSVVTMQSFDESVGFRELQSDVCEAAHFHSRPVSLSAWTASNPRRCSQYNALIARNKAASLSKSSAVFALRIG
jgi:hypothetical protein